ESTSTLSHSERVAGLARSVHRYCPVAVETEVRCQSSSDGEFEQMTRVVLGDWGDAQWRRVSSRQPCPICASSDGCSVHEEDDFASCMQKPSDWPLINGAWLHRVAGLGASAVRPTRLGPARAEDATF